MLEYKDDMTSDYNTETNYIYRNLGHNLIDDPLKELIDLMRDLNSASSATWLWSTLLAPGAFDNYWLSASNYTMYKNPTMAFRQVNWYDFRSDGDRPLVRKLIIENKAINGMFEQILKELVSMASKMQSLKPRIEMYNQMLSVDPKPRPPSPNGKGQGSIDNDDADDEEHSLDGAPSKTDDSGASSLFGGHHISMLLLLSAASALFLT
ncbi:hypothetical protein BGZ59_011495 [Podila verticillata]|nr:hypothetical protein BGZ59_011495 [Podila verticillata]